MVIKVNTPPRTNSVHHHCVTEVEEVSEANVSNFQEKKKISARINTSRGEWENMLFVILVNQSFKKDIDCVAYL